MSKLNRRQMLSTTAAVGSALAASQAQAEKEIKVSKRIRRVAKNGKINHSIVAWCFQDYWSPDELMPIAKEMGCDSVELMDSKYYPDLKRMAWSVRLQGSILAALRLCRALITPNTMTW